MRSLIRFLSVVLFFFAIGLAVSTSFQNIGLQAKAQLPLPADQYPACMPQGYRALKQGPSATCYVPGSGLFIAIRCELEDGWCSYIDCQPPCFITYEE